MCHKTSALGRSTHGQRPELEHRIASAARSQRPQQREQGPGGRSRNVRPRRAGGPARRWQLGAAHRQRALQRRLQRSAELNRHVQRFWSVDRPSDGLHGGDGDAGTARVDTVGAVEKFWQPFGGVGHRGHPAFGQESGGARRARAARCRQAGRPGGDQAVSTGVGRARLCSSAHRSGVGEVSTTCWRRSSSESSSESEAIAAITSEGRLLERALL